MEHSSRFVPLALVLGLGACADSPGPPAPPRILTAFFGLDDALPAASAFLCASAPGKDGMPLVFSVQLDASTLDASDFLVTTASGATFVPECATLAPAGEADELRTVLLIGSLGSLADPPARVDVIGDVAAVDGATLRGLTIDRVVALADGPSLALAERTQWPDPELDAFGGCTSDVTLQVVTVTWSGGVRDPAGGQDFTLANYEVTLADGRVVSPVALADLGDNDNVQDLCLGDATPARRVRVVASTAIDPRGDLNPDTAVDLFR